MLYQLTGVGLVAQTRALLCLTTLTNALLESLIQVQEALAAVQGLSASSGPGRLAQKNSHASVPASEESAGAAAAGMQELQPGALDQGRALGGLLRPHECAAACLTQCSASGLEL